jgi:two-component system KDP operon response regulator KdpE
MNKFLARGRRKLVLVVEDDLLLLRPIERAASEIGIDIIHAQNGEDGVRLASERTPDLIVLDLGLPDMDGARVLGCLKSAPRTVSIPVIIYSGRTDHDDKIEFFRFGADDYVEKPIDIDMLMRRIEHHIFKASETMTKSGIVATGYGERAVAGGRK